MVLGRTISHGVGSLLHLWVEAVCEAVCFFFCISFLVSVFFFHGMMGFDSDTLPLRMGWH